MYKRFNPAVRILLAIVFYFVVMFSFLGILALLGQVDRVRTDYGFLASMNILVGITLCASTFVVYRVLDGGKPLQLGFGIKQRDFGFLLAALPSSLVGAAAFTWLYGGHAEAEFHLAKLADGSFVLLLAYGLFGWLIGVLQEETLCRGYFMANLQRFGIVGMIVLSSLIFTLTHIPTKGLHPVQSAVHLLGGICYAYIYLKSGSLWVSAAVHAMHNFALDILFNDDYSVSLVSFGQPLTDVDKLLQQLVLAAVVMLIARFVYGGKALAPAANLQRLWREDSRES